MPDALEEAVLSGAIFRDGHTAFLSEYRPEDRDNPSPTNTDDELGSDLDDFVPPSSSSGPQQANSDPSSRTGPKGVIRDEREAKERNRVGQLMRTRAANEEMERRALLGGTWEEDEAGRKEDEERRIRGEGGGDEAVRARRREERRRELMEGGGTGRKGHLREVSLEGYLNGVEDDGWTVVLVYEPSLAVLPTLLPQLQRLASRLPPPSHSFLLARATTLSFSLLPSGEPDKDVLPTMLIYGPGGELLENWVRVDLMLQGGASAGGLEGLLVQRGVVPPRSSRDDDSDADNSEDDRQDSD